MEYQNRNISLDALSSSLANARAMGKGRGIPALAAQIEAQGLIQPLTVYKSGGTYHVDAGHRRLAAIRQLADAGRWDGPVPCRIIPASATSEDRRAISFSENLGQLPMHPLDKMRVLSGFIRKGATVETVAARFGIDAAEVSRVLTLSNLALPIRDALAKGKLAEDKALTYASCVDRELQMKVFGMFGTGGTVPVIRARLRKGQGHTSAPMSTDDRLFRFVADEYRECDGPITEDLFSDHGTVDGQLVRRLATDKLRTACEAELSGLGIEAAGVHVSLGQSEDLPGFFEWEDDLAACPVPLHVLAFVPRYSASAAFVWLVNETDWNAHEAAERAKAEEAAREDDDAGEVAPDSWTHAEPVGDDDRDHDDDAPEVAPVPEVDPETQCKAPSRTMDKDTETALGYALAQKVATDPRAAMDAVLFVMLTGGQLRRTPLHMTIGNAADDHSEWPENVPAPVEFLNHASDVWEIIDGLSDDDRAATFAWYVSGAISANTAGFQIDRPRPTDAARTLAQRVGVDMHTAWSAEDRLSYLGRMTKADLVTVVLRQTGENAETLMKLDKAALVERATAARWVPSYFAGIEAPEADDAGEPEADALTYVQPANTLAAE